MPRVLTCLDEVPASDGSCVQQAWTEQVAMPALPNVDQASEVGAAMLAAILIIRAMIMLLKPPKEETFYE